MKGEKTMSTEIERVSEEEIRQVLLEIADGSENDGWDEGCRL